MCLGSNRLGWPIEVQPELHKSLLCHACFAGLLMAPCFIVFNDWGVGCWVSLFVCPGEYLRLLKFVCVPQIKSVALAY